MVGGRQELSDVNGWPRNVTATSAAPLVVAVVVRGSGRNENYNTHKCISGRHPQQ